MLRTHPNGGALFVCQAISDRVARVPVVPTGDGKTVATKMKDQPGGNGFTAAMTTAWLGFKPHVISGIGNDPAGQDIVNAVLKAGIHWHPRAMKETPKAVIIPNDRGRVIISPPEDEDYEEEYSPLNIQGCRLLHIDGRQRDATKYYVGEAERLGIDRYCDFGRIRPGIEDLLPKMTHPSVSERFCEQMGRSVDGMLTDLGKHCKVAIVTLGANGLKYAVEGGLIKPLPAFEVAPEDVVDENGLGDGFNGGRVFADLMWPDRPLEDRLRFAMAVPAFTIKRFGNEPPTLEEVYQTLLEYGIKLAA
ncbi:MAG: PfkB family carbohydrate kinase [bacterium]|nr:PfkB family carbohydrate kinase [bacterium]